MKDERILRALRPRSEYIWTRWVLVRGLGFIYLVAFFSLYSQLLPLLGSEGLLPVDVFLEAVEMTEESPWLRLPTLFWWNQGDQFMLLCCGLGIALSATVFIGFANVPILFSLWALYLSFVHVGQVFYGYGWESLLLEAGVLALFLVPPLRVGPLAPPAPHPLVLLLFRWLVFRVMFGAGLIKLRGDPCWVELECLFYHYETQPNPHPGSWLLHQAPSWFHSLGVLVNHFVELVVPFFVFGPRLARLASGIAIVAFQATLILSGNLSFLNWLTIVIAFSCFDDKFFGSLLRWSKARCPGKVSGENRLRILQFLLAVRDRVRRVRMLPRSPIQNVVVVVWALVVAALSLNPVFNMLGTTQRMNASYDPLRLVNTYGAFGSIGKERFEVILEGTRGTIEKGPWREYEFPCKPGPPERAPCLVTPYHYRLQWQFWFASFGSPENQPWLPHLAFKLLTGSSAVAPLIEHNPFPREPPRYIRARLFRYSFTTWGQEGWWRREPVGLWMRPMARDDPELLEFLSVRGLN